jgi:hypothetical protein
VKLNLLLNSLFVLISFTVLGQEEIEKTIEKEINEIVIPDSLAYAKNYSPRIQRLINDPLTPSRAAFYSAIIPGFGQLWVHLITIKICKITR